MASTGFTFAGAGSTNSPGSIAWTSPGNIVSSNNVYATANTVIVPSGTTQTLHATTFGFSVPSGATIDGIEVRIERHSTSGDARDIADNNVQLIKGGTLQGANKASGTNWNRNTDTSVTYGGAADLWTLSLTDTDVNASNFGVALQAIGVGVDDDANALVDGIEINVHYTESGGGVTIPILLHSYRQRRIPT